MASRRSCSWRGAFDFVVVDLEDFFHREQFRVLQLSESILFAFRLDFNGLRNTRRALEFLQNAGIDDHKLKLVANQSGRSKELSVAQAEEALRMKITCCIPDDPKTQNHALNAGVPAVVDNPRSKLAKAIKQLIERRSRRNYQVGTMFENDVANRNPFASNPLDRAAQIKQEVHNQLLANMDVSAIEQLNDIQLRGSCGAARRNCFGSTDT